MRTVSKVLLRSLSHFSPLCSPKKIQDKVSPEKKELFPISLRSTHVFLVGEVIFLPNSLPGDILLDYKSQILNAGKQNYSFKS